MQNLGLSSSTPKTESRLKTLFWPTIRYESDVDVVAQQGFWICFVIAVFTLTIGLSGRAIASGCVEGGFFFLGGVGIRERSRLAAAAVFSVYLLGTALVLLLSPAAALGAGIVVRVIFLSLLLANVRATWLSAAWRSPVGPTLSAPRSETLGDKFADRLPAYLWPKLKWLFYVLTVLEVALLLVVFFFTHRHR